MRNYFDRLPAAVRKRLATSRFNICPACMDEEARYQRCNGAERCGGLMGTVLEVEQTRRSERQSKVLRGIQ
jgi:hypothetical protein